MADNIAIKVKNLSKVYKIFNKPIDRVKESLNIFGKRYSKDFYALNDISFEIKKGESVGIVGKNGAGKSTLLKIITGVLVHSSGIVKVNGKVSALLELGAGFNPEFTGIENIFLNGTIMGYSHEEMKTKINKIIDFADIGDFVYQPVKMYSSGMFARLAFAVAINVEPDILIVDETLSVGDIAFQYKCFQRMEELKKNGVTMIIVSHSSQQIMQNCDRVILINEGNKIVDTYDIKHGIAEYEKIIRNIVDKNTELEEKDNFVEELLLNEDEFKITANKQVNEKRIGNYRAIIKDAYISDFPLIMEDSKLIESGNKKYINFYILSKENINNIVLGVSLRNKEGVDIWGDNNLSANTKLNLKKGVNKISYEFFVNIAQGDYLFCAGIASFENGERQELDHRWPMKVISIMSVRGSVGVVYAPIKIIRSEKYITPEKMDNIFNFITKDHFSPSPPDDIAKEVFKNSIKMVEIETFSFCNRKCWFCPNSTIDRVSNNVFMSENIYLKILNELALINYSNVISFSRYNEPLSDRTIIKRIQQARNILPKSILHTNTNGDYITNEYLSELYDAGLTSMAIQIYLNQDEDYKDSLILDKFNNLINKMGNLPYEVIINEPDEWYEVKGIFKDMNIRIYSRNFKNNGCNRGGLVDLKNIQRLSPCLSPFHHIIIDYNANVMPCCNLRSDALKHKNYVLGNVAKDSLYEIYFSKMATKWRKNLIEYAIKPQPCTECNFSIIEDNQYNREIVADKLKLMKDGKI
jgi:lipopolysaccharide transport system ATP-binding protein